MGEMDGIIYGNKRTKNTDQTAMLVKKSHPRAAFHHLTSCSSRYLRLQDTGQTYRSPGHLEVGGVHRLSGSDGDLHANAVD